MAILAFLIIKNRLYKQNARENQTNYRENINAYIYARRLVIPAHQLTYPFYDVTQNEKKNLP